MLIEFHLFCHCNLNFRRMWLVEIGEYGPRDIILVHTLIDCLKGWIQCV